MVESYCWCEGWDYPLVVSRWLFRLRLQPTDDCAKDLLASSATGSARRLCLAY